MNNVGAAEKASVHWLLRLHDTTWGDIVCSSVALIEPLWRSSHALLLPWLPTATHAGKISLDFDCTFTRGRKIYHSSTMRTTSVGSVALLGYQQGTPLSAWRGCNGSTSGDVPSEARPQLIRNYPHLTSACNSMQSPRFLPVPRHPMPEP